MGSLQARILEHTAMVSSRGSPWPRDRTRVSYGSGTSRQVLYYYDNLEIQILVLISIPLKLHLKQH